jgi:hypothetical protein
VSLILEALKKVERERASPEQRGFLVLGPAAWAPTRSNLGWILGMIAAAGLAGIAVYVLTRPGANAVQSAPRSEEPVAQAPPSTAMAERTGGPAVADWKPPPPPSAPRARPVVADAARAAADAARAVAAAPDRTPPGPVLLLHAISVQDGVPIAVINERVVREGDAFDGIRILRIGAAEVEVEVAGARRTLRF